jgi:hypothetical protein
MSLKKVLKKAEAGLNASLMQIKADVNTLKTKVGAEAKVLKGKIAKASDFYVNNVVYAPLLPLMPTMIVLLKSKGVKLKDAKSIKDVADTFYKTFVNPANTLEEQFEYTNFEGYVMQNLDLKGGGETKTDAEAKGAGLTALLSSNAMANSENSEKKDPTNSAGKTAGGLACTALMAVGVPVPPAVGSAVGGVVQGIVRGIINFFKNKKKEGNKEVIDALQQGGADAEKIDINTGEVNVPQNDKKMLYILGGLVAIVVVYFVIKKK